MKLYKVLIIFIFSIIIGTAAVAAEDFSDGSSTAFGAVAESGSSVMGTQIGSLITDATVRDIGATETPIGIGPGNALRDRTTYVGRPANGYDTNDQQTIYLVAKDNGLTPGTPYTYGFKYRREGGGSGTCYFNYSNVNSVDIGFSGVMIMKITEIAQ